MSFSFQTGPNTGGGGGVQTPIPSLAPTTPAPTDSGKRLCLEKKCRLVMLLMHRNREVLKTFQDLLYVFIEVLRSSSIPVLNSIEMIDYSYKNIL